MRALALSAFALVTWSASAHAQNTWVDNRTTPTLDEIVAVDKTGEPNWLYGFEDLVGDGETFAQQEQSIDIRTAYAAADNSRFWARVYVSDPSNAGGNVTVYVFIDTDKSPSTGGGADADEIDSRFTTDPGNGGYEHVLQIGGNGSISVWDWEQAMTAFVEMPPMADQALAEIDQDVDPIEINSIEHGYLQGSVELALVGLTAQCNADLFFRSIQQGGTATGDLDVGVIGPCVPLDDNGDDVPDIAVPPDGCISDDQCPGGGVCVNGHCFVPEQCLQDSDCDADERCQDGVCVPIGGASCDNNYDCDDLVCRDDTCQPCTPGSDECGNGRVCNGDGRCIGGVTLEPGQEAQGGSFTCAIAPTTRPLAALVAFATALAALLRRRTQRRQSRS